MKKGTHISKINEESLLEKFNKRDATVFCDVYRFYFNRLYHFAEKQFSGTVILAEDVVQDVFASIWEKRSLKFNSFNHLIGYIYLSIRNRYKDYSIKQLRIDKFNDYHLLNDENMFSTIVESETLSIISNAIDVLPSECAKVFRMHIDGWDIKDIAIELNKSQSTIYNQRKEAIDILKRKISDSIFLYFLILFFVE